MQPLPDELYFRSTARSMRSIQRFFGVWFPLLFTGFAWILIVVSFSQPPLRLHLSGKTFAELIQEGARPELGILNAAEFISSRSSDVKGTTVACSINRTGDCADPVQRKKDQKRGSANRQDRTSTSHYVR